MWPFKKETGMKIGTVPSYQGIKFGTWIYEPKVDITPHEVSLMFPLFVIQFSFDRQAYIDKYGLRRHFKEMEDESVSGRDKTIT